MPLCPLCKTETEKLLTIPNPGKQYSQCCARCDEVAGLITRNYPYGESWYNDYIPYLEVIFYERGVPAPMEDGFLATDKARDYLKQLRDVLLAQTRGILQELRSIDVIVCLARLFDDLTYSQTTPDVFEKVRQHAQQVARGPVDASGFLVMLADLRIGVVFLQNLTLRYGSGTMTSRPHTRSDLAQLLFLVEQIRRLSLLDDALFYRIGGAEQLVVLSGKIAAFRNDGSAADSGDPEVAQLIFEEIRALPEGWAGATIDEFYTVVRQLDDVAIGEFGFSVSDLLTAYLGLAEFAAKRRRRFMMTPIEVQVLVEQILRPADSTRAYAILAYLTLSPGKAATSPHHVDAFYSPLFLVPVGGYQAVLLDAAIIDFARANFFHDLTYGSHSWLSENRRINDAYSRIKQQYITGPFEHKVADVLLQSGWQVKINVVGELKVGNKATVTVPKEVGEIDFIALSPDKTVLLVGDCKYVFEYGANAKEIRTLTQRFFTGEKSYVAQIERKRKWVAASADGVSQALGNDPGAPVSVRGVLVTRNRISPRNDTTTPIVALSDLTTWLDNMTVV